VLAAATAVGTGAVVDVRGVKPDHSAQFVTEFDAPTAGDTATPVLEGSLDGVNWVQLWAVTAGNGVAVPELSVTELKFVADKPVAFLRGRVAQAVGDVTCSIYVASRD